MAALSDLYRGNTKNMTVTVSPTVDITGDTIILTLKKNENDSAALLTVTQTSLSDPTNGITTIAITAAQSAALPLRRLQAEFTWLRASPSEEHTVWSGTLLIKEPIRDPV